jgi:hypothetical protein
MSLNKPEIRRIVWQFWQYFLHSSPSHLPMASFQTFPSLIFSILPLFLHFGSVCASLPPLMLSAMASLLFLTYRPVTTLLRVVWHSSFFYIFLPLLIQSVSASRTTEAFQSIDVMLSNVCTSLVPELWLPPKIPSLYLAACVNTDRMTFM